MNIPERVTKWVENWLATQNQQGNARIDLLAGDGSVRVFYRVSCSSFEARAKAQRTFILLSDPGWILSKDYAAHQEYLTSRGIPVPRFQIIDEKEGFGVMEDLGDELLQHRLVRPDTAPAQRFKWLEEAIRLLARLHGETFPVPASLPVATRRFDTTKYSDELKFTFEHLHEKFLGLPAPSEKALAAVHDFCAALDAYRPDVFSHRDYHTRNLLVMDERLFMIDFQDARLGPIHYDLASLLYDAYVPTSSDEKRKLLEAYRAELARYPLDGKIPWKGFDADLKRVAFQRTVKAAGSFASFYTRHGKRTHLPYLRPALESARDLAGECFPAGAPIHRALDVELWLDRLKGKDT